MAARVTRRGVTRWVLSAAIGGVAEAKLRGGTAVLVGAASPTAFATIGSRIRQAIAGGDATGVAVAVVHGGRIVWEQGFGWANREARLQATPHTPFSLASVTKPFTATTLMTLVAEGRLALDEPANKYLGDSRIFGGNGDADAATVRLLGAHASGLPGFFESYDADEAGLAPTANALMKAYGRLAYPPATCYEYSNLGFAALDRIASSLTQTELGALMQQRVLRPLGLNDSFFGSDNGRWQRSAARYDAHGRPIPHYTTSTPASGELYASAHDLARFALFNMRGRSPGLAAILNDGQIAELHRPVFTGPSGVATTFGWFQGHTASGAPFFFKSGGDPGVANRMCFLPSHNLACAVVTNRSNGWELASSVCDDVLGNYLPNWRRPVEDCGPPDGPFVATPAWRGRWQGVLEDGGATVPVRLEIASEASASLTLGTNRAEPITGMRSEGEACIAVSVGSINSPDAQRTGATSLQLKLLPRNGRLVGRVFAIAGDPNIKNVRLPYVFSLQRSLRS